MDFIYWDLLDDEDIEDDPYDGPMNKGESKNDRRIQMEETYI